MNAYLLTFYMKSGLEISVVVESYTLTRDGGGVGKLEWTKIMDTAYDTLVQINLSEILAVTVKLVYISEKAINA